MQASRQLRTKNMSRVQRRCVHLEVAEDMGQLTLTITHREEPLKDMMAGLGGDAKIPFSCGACRRCWRPFPRKSRCGCVGHKARERTWSWRVCVVDTEQRETDQEKEVGVICHQ